MKRTRKKFRDADSSSNWLGTYGDMVTLLLAFFVLLFSFSTLDVDKWKKIVYAFTNEDLTEITEDDEIVITGLDITDNLIAPSITPMVSPSPTPNAIPTTLEKNNVYIPEFDTLYDEISTYISTSNMDDDIYIEKNSQGLLLRFSENLLFNSAQAYLKPEARETISDIAIILLELEHTISMVRVEGHTDSAPIYSKEFPSNWELSAKRSIEVVKYLIGKLGFDSTKVSVVAYGEFQPIAPNDTRVNKQKNRRVEMQIEPLYELEDDEKEELDGNNPES